LESGTTIPWEAIESIGRDDESKVLLINHIGGLRLEIPFFRFIYDGEAEEVNQQINDIISRNKSIEELLASCEESDGEMAARCADEALDMVFESRRIYDMVVDELNVVQLGEFQALCGVSFFVEGLHNIGLDVLWLREEFFDWVRENSERIQNLRGLADFWVEKISAQYSDELKSAAAMLYAQIEYIVEFDTECFAEGRESVNSVDHARRYALAHSFADEGEICESKNFLTWFDEECFSPDNAKNRKVIVCTDEKRSLEKVGEVIDGVAVIRQEDLEKIVEYQQREDPRDTIIGYRKWFRENNRGEDITMAEAKQAAAEYAANRKARKLIFEEGHPRNGMAYVQHPMSPNVYIELGAFHASVLERKYNELIRILTELGVKEIRCSVENSDSTDSKVRSHRHIHANVDVTGIGGAEGDAGKDEDSTNFLSLYKKLDTHLVLKPHENRRVPDDLVFYPYEEGWRRLAEEVLSGRLLHALFELTYRKDYAVTGKYVRTLSAKVSSAIPGYAFGVGGEYDDNFEDVLKQLESTTWHYEVDFGDGGTSAPDDCVAEKAESAPKPDVASDEGRANVLARAKRLAETEEAKRSGVLSEAQRADLERFASKNGISEDELEDLIDEAFS